MGGSVYSDYSEFRFLLRRPLVFLSVFSGFLVDVASLYKGCYMSRTYYPAGSSNMRDTNPMFTDTSVGKLSNARPFATHIVLV